MSARRSISLVLVWLCGVAGGLLLWSDPALAQRMHVFSSSFGSEGSGNGQFSRPGAVAVNDATGDVYVIDRGNSRVEVFSATGEYLSQFNGSASPTGAFSWPPLSQFNGYLDEGAIAVDNSINPLDPSAGDVYVVDTGHHVIDKFSASGVYIGQVALPIHNLAGIAVDANGSLWVELGSTINEGRPVTEYEGSAVDEFNDASANEFAREVIPTVPVREGRKGGGAGFIGLAVDSEGDIYEGFCPNFEACSHDSTTEPVTDLQLAAKFTGNGGLLSDEFDSEDATGLALDQSSNDVYVDNMTSIAAFGPTGSPIERFGSPQLGSSEGEYGVVTSSEGIAVNSATGTVYASDAVDQAVYIFTAFVVPDVSMGSASNFGETSVTVSGVVDPDGLPVKSCVFEYGTTTSYGQEAECSANPGSGDAPVAVSTNLTGLERLTSYHYRLKVSNANGSNVGRDGTFFTPEPVTISEEAASDVSSASALFSARVDPGDSETTFHFEYGPSVSYGESLPVPAEELGAGVSRVPVSVRPEDLAPGTTYHVRLVASNVLGAVHGPDETFTTQAAGGALVLPDGREWEMVSPPQKYGAGIEPLENALVEAAEDGSAIAYVANSSIVPNPAGNPTPAIPVQVLSRRGAGGWSTEEISLPRQGETGNEHVTAEYRLFSGDLSSALVEPLGEAFDSLSPEATGPTPYLRDDETGSYLPLVTAGNVVPPGAPFSGPFVKEEHVHVLVATPDLSHVVLQSPFALTANAIKQHEPHQNAYEWVGGRLKLVNVLPDGEASEGANVTSSRHSISTDGSRVFWGAPGGALYMRDTVTEQTEQVDVPASGVPSPPWFYPAFQGASADGSKAFFTEAEPLTSDSKVPPAAEYKQGPSNDLYVNDMVTGVITDLTGGGGESGSEPGDVQGEVLGASEDGSIVYFVAKAALASGAEPGENNLYVASATGSTWSTRLVGVLSGEDERDWAGAEGHITSRVSPNGRFLAFMSDRSLTGYDNRDINSGAPDEEVFLYDEASNHLVCTSCNPTGERPAGIYDEGNGNGGVKAGLLTDRDELWEGHWLAAIVPGWTGVAGYKVDIGGITPYQQRYLSDEGRLFFNGFDSLVAQATNGRANVYEYEPEGVDSCTQSGGCVGLISSGTSGEESAFMDASESGNDVFFLTASRLVPQDVDTSMDVYDAHVCSSSQPCITTPVSPPPCSSGDACKAAPSLQPAIFGAPSSATFSGKGNLPAVPAKPVVTGKALTRAQKLARALRACAGKRRRTRAVCERQARKRYGARQAGKANASRKGER